jgi:hypothetical protein
VTVDPGEVKGLQILANIAAKALDDDEYRQTLVADPTPILRAEGVEVPDGVKIEVVQNTKDRVYLVLPSEPPTNAELDVNVVELPEMIPFNKF